MAFDGTTVPRVVVEFGVNASTLTVGSSVVGASIGGSTSWSQVDATLVRQIDTRRGRQREDQSNDVGTLTITFDNNSGQFDPDNGSSIWATAGVSKLRSGLAVRIVNVWASTNYVTFVGKLESIIVDQGMDSVATMTVIDALGTLGETTAPEFMTARFAGETATARVNRLLDIARWATSKRTIQGTVALCDTMQGGSVTSLIEEVARAQMARFYATMTGSVAFLALPDRFTRPFRTYFSDDQSASTIEYDNLTTSPGALYVTNKATVVRLPWAAVTASYKPSVSSYGQKAIQWNAPILSNTVAHKTAAYLARRRARPLTRITKIEFSALALGSIYPDFFATELGDLTTVERTTVDGRNIIMDLVVEGIEQSITPESWRVVYYTSPLDPFSI